MPRPRRQEPEAGHHPGRQLAVRLAALAAAAVWGVFYFGLIDLLVVIIQDERFADFYLLETGWGLLYTALVGLPLVAFAYRPRSSVPLQQLLVVAAAVLLCAVITPVAAQAAPALLLAMTAVVLSRWSGFGLLPARRLSARGVDRGTAVLAAAAAVAAGVYAAQMIQASRAGEADDDTWGLMHLPMQAAFGLSVAGVAILAVLARAARSPGWQTPAVSAAASAVWVGVVSLVYPGHTGSLGRAGGLAAVAWGVAFAVGAVTRGRKAARRTLTT